MTLLQAPPEVNPTHCSACGAPLVGPVPLYRSLYACSIGCEDAIDQMYLRRRPDPVSQLIDDWTSG